LVPALQAGRPSRVTRRWPFPGDRAADRARQVAQQYRGALANVDPDACRLLDWAATQAGETWIVPQIAQYAADDLITVPEAAELTGRSVRWVYGWVAEDRATRMRGAGQPIRVRAGDVQEAAARPT